MGANVPGSAVALVVGDKVDASSTILAGVDLTVINVVVAVLAGESDGAPAFVVTTIFSHRTGGTIGAGGASAGVNLHVTVDSLEALGAFADVSG